jgi:hypothetical protein
MWHDRVRTLVAALADGVMATKDEVRGLGAAELAEIEHDQRAPLAGAYRLFLELGGGGAGHFLQGSDVFYPAVIGLGQAARQLLETSQVSFTLQDSDRVFLTHQGYQFLFLHGGGPDPPVWYYLEGAVPDVPVQVCPSFTGWLESVVKDEAEARASLVAWYQAKKRKRPGERRVYFRRTQADGGIIESL